jgi:hypothetical protein
MTFDTANIAADGAAGTIRFRRGFMLGDGTRAGKGCHSTGVWRQGWANICDALIATMPSCARRSVTLDHQSKFVGWRSSCHGPARKTGTAIPDPLAKGRSRPRHQAPAPIDAPRHRFGAPLARRPPPALHGR